MNLIKTRTTVAFFLFLGTICCGEVLPAITTHQGNTLTERTLAALNLAGDPQLGMPITAEEGQRLTGGAPCYNAETKTGCDSIITEGCSTTVTRYKMCVSCWGADYKDQEIVETEDCGGTCGTITINIGDCVSE